MGALTIALRTVHYASAIGLFGEFVFFLAIWLPCPSAQRLVHAQITARRRLLTVTATWLLVAIASGAGWFAIVAAAMSGLPLEQAVSRETLGLVLTQTLFGQVWALRLGLALAIGVLLLVARLEDHRRDRVVFGACALLAGSFLACLAWAGHANVERGTDRIIHHAADVMHLLGAGVWLGALAPLACVLAMNRRTANAEALDFSAWSARRFSALGIASVGTLLATGMVNAWYTLGSVAGLFETHYGRLLLLKLCLFGAMMALAAFNRSRLTPLISDAATDLAGRLNAVRRLRRNAHAEQVFGVAILAVVGALGIAVPAMHG